MQFWDIVWDINATTNTNMLIWTCTASQWCGRTHIANGAPDLPFVRALISHMCQKHIVCRNHPVFPQPFVLQSRGKNMMGMQTTLGRSQNHSETIPQTLLNPTQSSTVSYISNWLQSGSPRQIKKTKNENRKPGIWDTIAQSKPMVPEK